MNGSCRDLRSQMDSEEIAKAFSALVSGGKYGYRTIIERKREPLKCSGCTKVLLGEEKFCPECGTKVVLPIAVKN